MNAPPMSLTDHGLLLTTVGSLMWLLVGIAVIAAVASWQVAQIHATRRHAAELAELLDAVRGDSPLVLWADVHGVTEEADR